MIETLKSTEVLVKEGFKVMVYCSDDPIIEKIGGYWCLFNNVPSELNWKRIKIN